MLLVTGPGEVVRLLVPQKLFVYWSRRSCLFTGPGEVVCLLVQEKCSSEVEVYQEAINTCPSSVPYVAIVIVMLM